MFNVGVGEVFVILLVCLVVFGPERFPEMTRQAGRLIGQLQLLAQRAPSSSSEQLKEEAGDELNLLDLRVGSLRARLATTSASSWTSMRRWPSFNASASGSVQPSKGSRNVCHSTMRPLDQTGFSSRGRSARAANGGRSDSARTPSPCSRSLIRSASTP